MPRPRLVSDDEVFAAFDAAIAEHGPNGVTLAIVAHRLGVTAPALMRRFGSKQGLFAAFMQQQLSAQPIALQSALERHDDPLEAVLALSGSTHQYSLYQTAYLRHLASFFLQLADDPTLVPIIATWMEMERRWIADRLALAHAAQMLKAEARVPELARSLQAVLHGARLQWAMSGDGSEGAWSRRALVAAITPWRV